MESLLYKCLHCCNFTKYSYNYRKTEQINSYKNDKTNIIKKLKKYLKKVLTN